MQKLLAFATLAAVLAMFVAAPTVGESLTAIAVGMGPTGVGDHAPATVTR